MTPGRAAAFVLIAGLALPGPARAGKWFDLGAAAFDTLGAEQDPDSREIFPPNAFGVFPRGSWVWQEVNVTPCASLRWPDQVCHATVRAFRIEFNDGGCGCGGFVEQASTLRLTYDARMVATLGVEEENLRVAYNYNPTPSLYNTPGSRAWTPLEGVVPNTTEHCFDIEVRGDILGVREYAIVTDIFVPIQPVTWSRIKTLYEP